MTIADQFQRRANPLVEPIQELAGTLPAGWIVKLEFEHEGLRRETFVRLEHANATARLESLVNGDASTAASEQMQERSPESIESFYEYRNGFCKLFLQSAVYRQ
ncbi:MAG: hypothetical protein R3C03_13150 [Pirellulaceae bacterium]